MTKSESKYFNTALLMDRALIELLAEKDIEYISVKEICQRAGVNRSTFYLHYETIGDILNEALEYIDKQFISSFEKDSEDFVRHITELPLDELVLINDRYLKPYLMFIYDNRAVYRAAVNNPAVMNSEMRRENLKKHVLHPIMARFDIPQEVRNYWSEYFIHGIWAIVCEWINGGCRESIEQMTDIIESCVRPRRAFTDGKSESQTDRKL